MTNCSSLRQNQELLKKFLREQSLFRDLGDNETFMKELVECIDVEEFALGEDIHREDQYGKNYLYLILKGNCVGLKKNNEVETLPAGEFFGEFPILDRRVKYEIRAQAGEDSCFGKIPEDKLEDLAKKFPEIWYNMARVLAERLRKQNEKTYNQSKNEIPRLFIGSSTESLGVAEALKNLLHDPERLVVEIWNEKAFKKLGKSYLELLVSTFENFDFGVFIFNADDKEISRDEVKNSTRDNVLFELGLFMGRHSRQRAFVLYPEGRNVKIPSDYYGITKADYKPPEDDDHHENYDWHVALKDAVEKIQISIKEANIAQQRV